MQAHREVKYLQLLHMLRPTVLLGLGEPSEHHARTLDVSACRTRKTSQRAAALGSRAQVRQAEMQRALGNRLKRSTEALLRLV